MTVTFSEPITGVTSLQPCPIVAGLHRGDLAVAATYNATTRVLTINPSATLPASMQYRVIITGGTARISDLAGNPLPTRSWTFTTGTAL